MTVRRLRYAFPVVDGHGPFYFDSPVVVEAGPRYQNVERAIAILLRGKGYPMPPLPPDPVDDVLELPPHSTAWVD